MGQAMSPRTGRDLAGFLVGDIEFVEPQSLREGVKDPRRESPGGCPHQRRSSIAFFNVRARMLWCSTRRLSDHSSPMEY